ncbi:hypothetical protein, partial [Pedobacter sp.]|uniref:hypothetical protein n=1 Tax=Pedobacter sp. TaxID=1411316 RepID=UPI002D80D80C
MKIMEVENKEDKANLRGISYILDRTKGEFRQEMNEQNRISFKEMDKIGSTYMLYIDEKTK